MLSDKQTNLNRIFKEEHPDEYKKMMETLFTKSWDIGGNFPDYPNVLAGWKDIVADWMHVCIQRYDEYAKQYDIAKKACDPIIRAPIFDDYPPLKGLYFSNLDMNMIALQKELDGL